MQQDIRPRATVHIELTEMLRCPENHEETYVVLATAEMKGRTVRRGTLGCPVCRREFLIVDGVVGFGKAPVPNPLSPFPGGEGGTRVEASAEALQAFLGLTNPGGYVVLVGSAVLVSADLATHIPGVHLVGINAPAGVRPSETLSLLTGEKIPLRGSMARGVVVGTEYGTPGWIDESVRVLLRGQRLVVLNDVPDAIAGAEALAQSPGLWVGQKR